MNFNKANKLFFSVTMFIVGFIFGFLLIDTLLENNILNITNDYIRFAVKIGTSLFFGLILYSLSGRFREFFRSFINQIKQELLKRPLHEIILASIGLVIGLIIAFLLTQLINNFNIGFFGSVISLIIYLVLGYLGLSLPIDNKDAIISVFRDNQIPSRKSNVDSKKTNNKIKKILDTSAIIDGRILELSKTGFLEGPLMLPLFILEELQHIADSSDSLKRNRGRRGLEVINGIRELPSIDVIIVDKMYDEIEEVDSKLIRLALDEHSKIITNDFNLNKVAEVQGVEVLNINELANALKPVAIPGESMHVQIIKQGQEQNQGVAYLDDGTMIVVENGKEYIGESLDVQVTSVLQTNAGKMIFAKIK